MIHAHTALCYTLSVDILLFAALQKKTYSSTLVKTLWTCVSPHSVSKPCLARTSFVLGSTLVDPQAKSEPKNKFRHFNAKGKHENFFSGLT